MAKKWNRLDPRAPLTAEQIRLIQLARRQCRLDEQEYRELLQGAAGVTSSKELMQLQFDQVLQRLKERGFKHLPTKPQGPSFGARAHMATDAQCDLIRGLWTEYRGQVDEKGLHRWLERFHKVSSLRFATTYVAQSAIEALKAMVERKSAQASAAGSSHVREEV